MFKRSEINALQQGLATAQQELAAEKASNERLRGDSETQEQKLRESQAETNKWKEEASRCQRGLDKSRRDLETLSNNVKQITQEPMPFFEIGSWGIRFADISQYQGDKDGNLASINGISLYSSLKLFHSVTVDQLKGLLAAYYRSLDKAQS